MSDTPEVAMTDSERELVTERAPARKKLWAFIQDDMRYCNCRKGGGGIHDPGPGCFAWDMGEKAATERIARFAEHEATRLERRDDNYGVLAAVALDNFAHAIRDGRRIDPEGELR